MPTVKTTLICAHYLNLINSGLWGFGGIDVAIACGDTFSASFQAVKSSARVLYVFPLWHEFVWTFICNYCLAAEQEEFGYSCIFNTSLVILCRVRFFRLWK